MIEEGFKGQAAKQVLSELLKKLRAFGLDEPDGDEGSLDALGKEDESDDTKGTDLDIAINNPELDPAQVADPTDEDDPLKDEMKQFFQKTDADKIGSPKGVRMNSVEIKAQPLKKGRL